MLVFFPVVEFILQEGDFVVWVGMDMCAPSYKHMHVKPM